MSSSGTSSAASLSPASSSLSLTSLLPIDFATASPTPRLLPAASIAYAARSVLTDPFAYADALLYGPSLGSSPLRTEIAAWLAAYYQVPAGVSVGRICITGGASQNLAAILARFTDPALTRAAWIVAPCARRRRTTFEDAGLGAKVRFVGEGGERDGGVDLRALEAGLRAVDAAAGYADAPAFKHPAKYPKLYRHVVYCMPTFKNPTGTTMSAETRRGLVQLARRHDALVVADDAFDFIRWGESEVLPRLVDLDREGRGEDDWGNAVSNGSFSKLVAPGCRVGWLEGSERFVKTLGEVGSTQSGGAPSQLVSTFVNSLLTTGTLESHLRNVLLPAFSRRHTALSAAITAGLLPLGVSGRCYTQSGGWFVWLRLPAWCPAQQFQRMLKEEYNVLIVVGEDYEDGKAEGESEGDVQMSGTVASEWKGGGAAGPQWNCGGAGDTDGRRYIRLCLAWEEEERLKEGVRRMADLLRKMKPLDAAVSSRGSVGRRSGGIDLRDLIS